MEFGLNIPTNKEFDAVALGLNAVDHIVVVPHFPEFGAKIPFVSHTVAAGGQCATAMVALSRLGLRTRYVGSVGSDETGRYQLQTLRAEGVEASGVSIVEGADTQIAFIVVDKRNGERTILWNRDDRLEIGQNQVDRAVVTSGRVLLLDGHNVAASISAAQFAREAGIPVVLDIDNIYPGADRLLELVDFLISSSSFPEKMTGKTGLRPALQRLAQNFGSLFVAATLGQEGALAYFRGEFIHSSAFKVDCRDTTGAGDAFHGGFIYGLLTGLSVEETLRFANAVAGLKCRAIGARTALPSLVEVTNLLGSRCSSTN
jgi:sulfofructose kinase